ncbi:MAG TPA: hypothetical protein VFU15_13480, partial [Bacteroidia bacterium]|nr:hypothetical protein [Bacteroidia bacterium]
GGRKRNGTPRKDPHQRLMTALLRNKILFQGVLLLCSCISLFAQNEETRRKIDMDRRSLSFLDDKSLEKSREYIRMDSTFYIGYMYQGAYMYYRAADEYGFNQAIVPLEKAMTLLEKDYDKELRTRTSDLFVYYRVTTYQYDYCYIAYWLQECYQDVEKPDKAFEVLQRVRDRNLQFENGIETFNTMAWIYHRNRMYTSKNFRFLKNSVAANDSMAHLYLDSAIYKTENDAALNVGLYDASTVNAQLYYTYHYKAILFDYEFNIDSSDYYYNILLRVGYYSSNNYANYKYLLGDFATADQFYREAEHREGSVEKRTREYFYMRGLIDIYKGEPDSSASLLKDVIDEQGYTPGFGWHSIAYARALQYEGLTAESQKAVNKAAQFHELHIGTTWGQEQYNLCIAMLNYENARHFEKEYYFENSAWWSWMNPAAWLRYSRYRFEQHNEKMILAQLAADDPERQQVIYPLFSSENLISFDEVNELVEGFGNQYFIKIYTRMLANDKRPLVLKYLRYTLGKLYLEDGQSDKAMEFFQMVINDPGADDPYGKLLNARACEGMALASGNAGDKDYWTGKMYETYPQLLPYSKLTMKFKTDDDVLLHGARSGAMMIAILLFIFGILSTVALYLLRGFGKIRAAKLVVSLPLIVFSALAGSVTVWNASGKGLDTATRIKNDMHNCGIEFTDKNDYPRLDLQITSAGDTTQVDYTVTGNLVSQTRSGSLSFSKDELDDAGKLIVYRLFGIEKKKIGETVPPEKTDKKK